MPLAEHYADTEMVCWRPACDEVDYNFDVADARMAKEDLAARYDPDELNRAGFCL